MPEAEGAVALPTVAFLSQAAAAPAAVWAVLHARCLHPEEYTSHFKERCKGSRKPSQESKEVADRCAQLAVPPAPADPPSSPPPLTRTQHSFCACRLRRNDFGIPRRFTKAPGGRHAVKTQGGKRGEAPSRGALGARACGQLFGRLLVHGQHLPLLCFPPVQTMTALVASHTPLPMTAGFAAGSERSADDVAQELSERGELLAAALPTQPTRRSSSRPGPQTDR